MDKWSLTVQKQAFWGGVIEEHANSGLSVKKFCQQKQLAQSTFYAWRKRMTLLNNESTGASPVSALPPSPSPAKVASSSLSPPAAPSLSSSFIRSLKPSPLTPSARFTPITVSDDEEVLSQHHDELDALSKPKEADPFQDMSHCPIEVVLSGGRTIRLRGRFDRQVFLEAVQVLESLSC